MSGLEIIEKHRGAIERLCRKYHVVRLRLIGSALTNQWNSSDSDFDFLVEYGPGRRSLAPLDAVVGLQMGLEEVLGSRVDAIDWDAGKNPYFRKYAAAGAVELYA